MFATIEEARVWRARWQRVNEITRKEERRMTSEERLAAFYALMDLTREMGWHTSSPEEIAEVRRRWKKIKGKRG